MELRPDETRDTRALIKRSKQLNRYRHLPLIAGTTLYWGMTVVLTRIDPALVLSGVRPLTAWGGGITPMGLLCGCVTPFTLIFTLIAPLYIAFADLTARRVYIVCGLLGFVALGNSVMALGAIFGGNWHGWLVLLWQIGLVLMALGCVGSASHAQVHRNILQCQECGYPLRPSIEAGSKTCPECGEEIQGAAFRAVDNLHARERMEADKSGRLSSPPTDLPPPPPPLTH
jgi:predicted RNA-binding Zn-ribbon protein involved in translation (DUF1610 family)